MAKFLVTGAAGFIGSNLVEELLNRGETVIGLDNFSGGFKENLAWVAQHPNQALFTFVEGDIRDEKTCKDVCAGADYVLHQAALGSVPRSIEFPLMFEENNINGTLKLLIAARDAGVKRFVFASSSSVYGDTPTLPKTETHMPTPKSPYAITKLTGEHLCSVFYECYGLPTVALRYFNVFGPRQNPASQYSAVIPKFVTAFRKCESPVIYGDGEQTRDFTFVKNVVQANLNACTASQGAFGKAMNIGCGSRISVKQLAEQMKQIIQSTAEIRYEPTRAGDVKDSLADIARAESLIGYSQLIQLDQGLQETIRWYLSQPL